MFNGFPRCSFLIVFFVSVHANATSDLTNALANANASYSGASALTVYAVEARNENAFRGLIRPSVEGMLLQITQMFAQASAKQIASRNLNLTNILTNAPQLITQPISFTTVNLRPFDIPVYVFAVYLRPEKSNECFFIVRLR